MHLNFLGFQHLAWEKANDTENILKREFPEVLEKYMPGGYYGVDKQGYPIWWDTTTLADIKGTAALNKDRSTYSINHELFGATSSEQHFCLSVTLMIMQDIPL